LILSDSPRFFVVIKNSFEVTVSDLVVEAPSDSPNTDGIDPSKSRKVRISGCIIENGDDGIAIKGGCQDIEVRNNVFRFGHGASVGSLGNLFIEYLIY
jgi:polygalacturonase